ncbi:unnamed protein product [Adineta steineri]|uniref:Snake toxin/toxin-like domain-containing protein n=1 Tax=Adineta steineri TaxID=433720 RepID=A0A818VZH5_9BILA|nr:unnamed protein product [Adineta steineri]CAF3717827.1 unnamed protein product [Adineta steineri]
MAAFITQMMITTLVLSVFYFHSSSALICWTCNPCPLVFSNTSSLVRAANCSSANTICVSNTVYTLTQTAQITKGCVTKCYPASQTFFGQGAFVDCCTTDYCNSSIRNQLSLPTYLLFIITFGFIFYYNQQLYI